MQRLTAARGRLDDVRARSAIGQVALVGAGSAFVALSAQIAIYLPISPVPITGQTLGALVVGMLLGSRLGAAALLVYLAEGLIGLPVFAPGATLGIARLLSPTGGYLVGLMLAAWIVGRFSDAGWRRSAFRSVAGLAAGTLAIYLPLDRAVAVGVVPFLAGDLLKVVVAVPAVLLKSRIARAG
jgi:biotin transport system substrate-specific component